MKIARLSERFKIKLGAVTVTVAPLSGSQKIEMTSLVRQDASGKLFINKPAQELFLIKHSVKAIEGLMDHDDKEYQLQFTDGLATLTDECAEEMLSFLSGTFFTFANTQAMAGLTGEVLNPFTGKVIEGVSTERLIKKEDLKEEEKK